jgi:hypothetical protein
MVLVTLEWIRATELIVCMVHNAQTTVTTPNLCVVAPHSTDTSSVKTSYAAARLICVQTMHAMVVYAQTTATHSAAIAVALILLPKRTMGHV